MQWVPLLLLVLHVNLVVLCPPRYGNCDILPYDDEFNRDVSNDPVDYMSECYLNAIGQDFGSGPVVPQKLHLDFGYDYSEGYGIPYSLASDSDPFVPVGFGTYDGEGNLCDYSDESDPGPFRIPAGATIEGSTGVNGTVPPPCNSSNCGDRHLISADIENCILYETFFTTFDNGVNSANGIHCCSAAKFNLSQTLPQRPLYYTSADAAGLPIFPGLAKYIEAISPEGITHALRVTFDLAQAAFTPPASHLGPHDNTSYLPYGARLRLKADFNETPYTDPAALALVRAFKKYGLIFADQGSNLFVSGATDPGWSNTIDQIQNDFKIYHTDFDVLQIWDGITRGFNASDPECNGVSANSNPNWMPTPASPCDNSSTITTSFGSGSASGSGSGTTGSNSPGPCSNGCPANSFCDTSTTECVCNSGYSVSNGKCTLINVANEGAVLKIGIAVFVVVVLLCN